MRCPQRQGKLNLNSIFRASDKMEGRRFEYVWYAASYQYACGSRAFASGWINPQLFIHRTYQNFSVLPKETSNRKDTQRSSQCLKLSFRYLIEKLEPNMDLQTPSASSILARRGVERPLLKRNQSSFSSAVLRVKHNENIDITKALKIVSLDVDQKELIKKDLKLVDQLRTEQIPATLNAEKIPRLSTPNKYEAWWV